jgi:hypothetical protein
VKCSFNRVGVVLEGRAESGWYAYLFYSRSRRRYVSLDGKGVDLGGCWSPGSSPGMIALERRPASSLAGRAGMAEGAVGSSLPPGSAESTKPVDMICSVVFDIEG